jgi:hypothetical protein
MMKRGGEKKGKGEYMYEEDRTQIRGRGKEERSGRVSLPLVGEALPDHPRAVEVDEITDGDFGEPEIVYCLSLHGRAELFDCFEFKNDFVIYDNVFDRAAVPKPVFLRLSKGKNRLCHAFTLVYEGEDLFPLKRDSRPL